MVCDHNTPAYYLQVICDKADGERVLGMHVVGDHAAEIVQACNHHVTTM